MIGEILFVEDNDDDAELTLRALREGRLDNVVRVRDGLEALEYVYRQGAFAHRAGGLPTLILLDLHMPRVDGIEMLQTLRSDTLTESIPVIILTSSADELHREDAKRLGVKGYLRKPVSLAAFTQVLAKMGLD